MSDDGGWTKSYRRKWRHPVFRNFRDAAVWSYLIDNAAWCDDTDVRFEGKRVLLKAGQIAVSERFLAEGFCCDRQVIRRIFDALEKDQMITREKTHGTTIITICKYREYQQSDDWEKPTSASEKTQLKPSSNPNIKEREESKKEDSDIVPSELLVAEQPIDVSRERWGSINGRSPDAVKDAVFEQWFWPTYPERKGGKEPARRKFRSALKHATADEILFGLSLYLRKREEINEPKFTQHAATWLNQRGWQDEIEEFESADRNHRRPDERDPKPVSGELHRETVTRLDRTLSVGSVGSIVGRIERRMGQDWRDVDEEKRAIAG